MCQQQSENLQPTPPLHITLIQFNENNNDDDDNNDNSINNSNVIIETF